MQGKKTSQETTATMSNELQTNPKGQQTAPKSPVGLLRKRGQEAIPKMQPAMMMFSSKYWARRGLSLDSAMYDQQHLASSMVSAEPIERSCFGRHIPGTWKLKSCLWVIF